MNPFLTFDPKPDRKGMPALKAIDTAVPGIQLTELLPVCASQMNHLVVIRSLTHDQVHEEAATELMHTGIAPPYRAGVPPALGTVLSFEQGGKEHPLPGYLTMDVPEIPESGAFGEQHLPFRLDTVANPFGNLHGSVGEMRERERSALLLEQDGEWSASHQQGVVRKLLAGARAAERIMYTPLLKAFNVGDEPEALRREYGPGFGEKCLLARRLVEAGCPFIEIGLGGWTGRYWIGATTRGLVSSLDRGLGTLVKDLSAKGMLADVLVVCATPYGQRPPSDGPPQAAGWSRGFSVVLAGGMLAGGVVHGDTGPDGMHCNDPVTVGELFATIYSACGLDWEKPYAMPEGTKGKYVRQGQPVQDLF